MTNPSPDTQMRDFLARGRAQLDQIRDAQDRRIAVIGMAARLPGADDLAAFWRLLVDRRDGLQRVGSAGALPEGHVPVWGGPAQADGFDAAFFGYAPRDAELLDPQQRMFLECAWHALEDAGHIGGARVGVWAAASLSSHLLRAVGRADAFQAGLANIGGMVAARTSFHLDLTGPSVGVQTTCSSSLVAVHQAMAALRAGECDMAIAGAVAVNQSRPEGYDYQQDGIASPDGTCRPFDAQAAGTVFTNGAAVLVLKRLPDALRDGDTVHGVLIGSAVNNDGAAKISLTAPSVSGQAAVLADALAGIGAETVDYVEAHGTGTALGDPIELTALNRAYGPGLNAAGRRCLLGAVKGNLGHLDAAAGMAGLVKILLALRHDYLPGTAHFTAPNPKCNFGAFEMLGQGRAWPRDPARPRRAGISAFGIGGTNAHLIVEEPPLVEASAGDGPQILTFSARSETSLARLREDLADALDGADLADAAFTLQTGRRAMDLRGFVIAATPAEAATTLRRNADPIRPLPGTPSPVFVFSGQGSQTPGMAREAYGDPAFRAALDECLALMPGDLRGLLLVGGDEIHQTRHTQPALFALEYALARMWMARGVQPVAMLGHSIGELAAATIAGVFDLQGAVRAVLARGALMQACQPGAMLAAMMSESEAAGSLPKGVEIAAVNGPRAVVLSGPDEAIDTYARLLDRSGIGARRLNTSHAFHSAMMEPALAEFGRVMAGMTLRAPEIPMLSNVTGDWLTEDDACDPDYWVRQLRQAVRFGDGVAQVAQLDHPLLIEIGPGQGLIRLARQTLRDAGRGVASLPETGGVLQATAEIWAAGVAVDWAAIHDGPRRRIPLPGYPFERHSYWLPPFSAQVEDKGWFHQPVWTRLPVTAAAARRQVMVTGALPDLDGQAVDEVIWAPDPPDVADALALAQRLKGRDLRLTIVARGMFEVTGTEVLDSDAAALAGLAPVIAQECGLTCRVLDIDGETGLADALAADWDGPAYALRGGFLWRRDHAATDLKPADFDAKGTFLIAGDLGDGLALAYANALLGMGARVVLAGHGADEALRGTDAVIHSGDETDADWLDAVLSPDITGAFHVSAMGDAFHCPLDEAMPAAMAARLAAKRAGVAALRKVLPGRGARFSLVQSSLSVLAGGHGFAAYAAANAAMEAEVALARRDGAMVWQAVQWDAVQTATLTHLPGLRLLTASEVWDASLSVLAQPRLGLVAVTPGSLTQRLTAEPAKAPSRSTEYLAPRDDYEIAVAAALSEMLGIPQVGANDNFFELGGHSLLAIQIINRLRREFSVELPVRALLYEAPTVAGIAAVIRAARETADTDADLLGGLLDEIESGREQQAG